MKKDAKCRHGCRFVPITPGLALCPHASYGPTSYLAGAVEDARVLMARAGGYETLLARIVEAEEAKKAAAKEEREERQKNPPASRAVRYG